MHNKINKEDNKMSKQYEGTYIVRCAQAGVFFGGIKAREGNVVTMTDVRKLWYWDGAAAVEQLALDGTKAPKECKFTRVVPEMEVYDPIQIIKCTPEAEESLRGVIAWAR